MKKKLKILLLLAISFSLIFSLISCTSYRPVLDQNAKYLSVSEKEAEKDIGICKDEAEEYLTKYKAEHATKEVGRSTIWGSIFGAITGLIWGQNLHSTLVGTAVGGGTGAVLGGASVAGEGTITPDQLKQRYISNCLARKGYSVIGWI